MEFIELALTNFKRFKEERFKLCSGLNIFCGPNEAGKSTIHEAICTALFGRERGQTVESWNGGPCSVELTYRSDGKIYRIERRPLEGISRMGTVVDSELTDLATGKDEIASTIADHLGISSRTVFENTVSIGQLDISRPGTSDMESVGSEIQRVLTGTAHISASDALKQLESKRDTVKGRARPTNPREYDKVTIQIRKLAEELADARRSRDHIRNLEEEQTRLEETIKTDSERFSVLEDLLDRHKRWSELKKRESEMNFQHEGVFGTLKKLRETLADLSDVQKDLIDYAGLVGKDDEIAEHLSKIDNRREELESRLVELQSYEEHYASRTSRPIAIILLTAAALIAVTGTIFGFLVDTKAFWAITPAAVLVGIYVYLRNFSGAAGTKHIAKMITSAQDELGQLDVEESSILSYMKCRDSAEVWTQIKTYRGLAARSHELEVTLDAVLGGRKFNDLEAQEMELARELSFIKRDVEDNFAGYSPSTEEAESWRAEFAAIQLSLPRAQGRLHEVLGSLEAERRNSRDVSSLEGELEFLHGRKNELEFLHKAYSEAITALTTVTQNVSEQYLPVLSDQATEILDKVTRGRYTSVSVKPGWQVSVDCRDKTEVNPSVLSIGAFDQLNLSLRIACGKLLSADRNLPIIMDDPFASFDRTRLDNALALLETLASENQIILLTHDPYTSDWAHYITSPSTIHELCGPDEKH